MPDAGILRDYRLCIFDADDTLRRTTVPGQPCPRAPGEWELLPGVAETLRAVPWNQTGGPKLGLASNQDQIAYGHLTLESGRALLRELAIAATNTLPPEAALQLCPHALEVDCRCRKPHPGMLQRIMEHYEVAPGETLFVGNAEVDRRAAEAAGVTFVEARDLFIVSG